MLRCRLEIKPAPFSQSTGVGWWWWGLDQNSISVTSHGSKRPIRRCQEAEKCKVTVHFTTDSVSVSLAASTVNFQRAVKVAGDRQRLHLLLFILLFIPSTPLCFVFQLTGQERLQDRKQITDAFFWRFPSFSIPIVLRFLHPSSSLIITRSSCSLV